MSDTGQGFVWRGRWRGDADAPIELRPSRIVLRPHQEEMLSASCRSLDEGCDPLVVSPTATGKTVVMSALARKYIEAGKRVLVLAHRKELLEQIRETMMRSGVHAEIEQAHRRATRFADAVVASVQTVSRARRQVRGPKFGLVIVDEAHHVVADSYKTAIERHSADRRRVIGFTATAERLDGKNLGEVFNAVAFEMHFPDAVEQGLIAPIQQRSIYVDAIDVADVDTRCGDLAPDQLDEVVSTAQALHGVAVPLLDQIHDRRTLVFCASVAHAKAVSNLLNDTRPGVSRWVAGETPTDVRPRTLAEFREGKFQILVNCWLLTEGFDDPGIECVAMARPTKSRAFYQQAIGRGTRLHPGKANLLVLDFCGNAGRHQIINAVDLFFSDEDSGKVRRETKRIVKEDPDVLVHEALRIARGIPKEACRYTAVDVGGFIMLRIGVDRVGRDIRASDTRAPAHWVCTGCNGRFAGETKRRDLRCDRCRVDGALGAITPNDRVKRRPSPTVSYDRAPLTQLCFSCMEPIGKESYRFHLGFFVHEKAECVDRLIMPEVTEENVMRRLRQGRRTLPDIAEGSSPKQRASILRILNKLVASKRVHEAPFSAGSMYIPLDRHVRGGGKARTKAKTRKRS